jgi:hypothetical protein
MQRNNEQVHQEQADQLQMSHKADGERLEGISESSGSGAYK